MDDSGDNEPETPPVITARGALLQVKNICSGCERCTLTGSSVDRAELAAGTLHQAGCPCRAEDNHRHFQVAVMLLVMNTAGLTVYISVLFDFVMVALFDFVVVVFVCVIY